METFAEMLAKRTRVRDVTFRQVLDAVRALNEHLIRADIPFNTWLELGEQVDVLEQYGYERATPEEMHAAAPPIRYEDK